MSAFASRHRALVGLRPFLILLSLAFGLTGCAPRETPVVAGNSTQTLHRGIGNDLADLDPHLATQAADYNVLSALLEGLVAEDPVDLHPVPGVAQSWTISPDGRTYTFHLRSDARWSNGAPVTAEDFVASWRRMLTPTLGADSANLLYIIQGAEAFHKSTAPWSAVGLAAPALTRLPVSWMRRRMLSHVSRTLRSCCTVSSSTRKEPDMDDGLLPCAVG